MVTYMRRRILGVGFAFLLVSSAVPAHADTTKTDTTGGIQLLPPMIAATSPSSTTVCSTQSNQVLTYSGTGINGQSAINCNNNVTIDPSTGNLNTAGSIGVGTNTALCTAKTAGTIRFNPTAAAFEGCNGQAWSSLAGGAATCNVTYAIQLSGGSNWYHGFTVTTTSPIVGDSNTWTTDMVNEIEADWTQENAWAASMGNAQSKYQQTWDSGIFPLLTGAPLPSTPTTLSIPSGTVVIPNGVQCVNGTWYANTPSTPPSQGNNACSGGC
jgi:hypothetical protein